MKKRLMALVCSMALIVGALSGCGNSGSKAESTPAETKAGSTEAVTPSTSGPVNITICSAASGGAWYTIGGAIADLYQNNIADCTSICGPGGGISNIFSVSSNEAQLGFGFPDDVLDAEAGVGDFEGNAIDNIRAVTSIYPAYLHMAVSSNSKITSIADLKGKTICTQQKGNAAEKMTRKVLEAYGLSYDDMAAVNFVGFTDAVDLIKDGHADALFYMSTYPYSSLQDLAESVGVKLLSLDDDHLKTVLDNCPAYLEETIPGGTYKGTDEDVTTIGVTTILFTNTEMPEDVVYQMTKLLYDNYDNLVTVNKSMSSMTPEYGCQTGITLHPGAEKYYKEIGALAE